MGLHQFNKPEKAPRPSRSSLARSIYDAIESSGGGPISRNDIKALLSATDDAELWNSAHKKLDKVLKSTQYQGYIIHNQLGDTYQIAPKSYYDERREIVNSSHKKRFNKLGELDLRPGQIIPVEKQVFNYYRVPKSVVRYGGVAILLCAALYLGTLL